MRAIANPNKDILFGLPMRGLPENIGLTGVARFSASYTGAIPPPFLAYATQKGGDFVGIIDSNLAQYNQFVSKAWYTGLSSIEKDLATFGEQGLYVLIRDKWGNQTAQEVRVWIAPGALVSSLAAYLLAIAVGFAVIMTAPHLSLSYRVLMIPALRKIGSLYAIPIILGLFPSLVAKLLERHRRRVHEKTGSASASFLLPDTALAGNSIAQSLTKRSTLFIEGPSGIGKSAYLRYLAHEFSSPKDRPLPVMTAVLINLRTHVGVSPVEAYQNELLNDGAFKDSEMAAEILRMGGLIFLLDGLNEVPGTTVASWAGFVSSHSERHFFVVSSQYVDSAFQELPVRVMPALSRDLVSTLLSREAGLDSQALAARVPEEAMNLARVPQNLMVIARLLRSNAAIPKSRFSLYETLLIPIFADWHNNGKADYITTLCLCAVSETEKADGSTIKALPAEVLTRLALDKVVVERGDNREFAHDHVRAFLVAYLLVGEWTTVLARPDLSFGSNWTLPLQFAAEKLPRTEIVKLIDTLVAKNSGAAAARAEEIAALAVRRFGADELGAWYGEFAKALIIARHFKNLDRAPQTWQGGVPQCE
jgi:hypothetical protein